MGSAQDLRRQLRYSTSHRTRNTKNGRDPYHNQIPEKVDSKSSNYTITLTAPSKFTSNTARNINPHASNNNQTKNKTTNTEPASLSFPNPANINLPNSTHMSVTSSRAPVPISNPNYRSTTSNSKSYVPPPPSLRKYQTREEDRAKQHNNNHYYSTVPRSSSVARSTTSNRTNRDRHQVRTNADTGGARSRSRAPSPYRSLTLPDEPEINRVFPNSDPNQVTDINVPIPSGHVSSKLFTSKVRPSASAGTRTRTSTVPNSPSVAASLGSASQYRRPTSRTAAGTSRTSRIPFIPPNGVPSVAAAPKPLTRSPSRSHSPSHTRIQPPANVDTSPSSATGGDSNAGPRVREGHVLSGLTARTEPGVPEGRNISQATVDHSFSRGRSPRRSLRPVQDVPAGQARNYHSTSRARSVVHPPPSISRSSAIPNPVPIPVPTPISHPQILPPHAVTIPGDPRSRKAMPFLDVGKTHMKQFGNYFPYSKRFRQNRAKTHGDVQPQDTRFGQEDYQVRSIDGGRRSHNVVANTPDDSTGGTTRARDSSHPPVMTRSPSRHQNQRSRSASRHSRHSKHSQLSQHTRHSYRAQSVHDTRAPVEVRIEGDHVIKNTRRNRAFKWKWPTSRFGMGKLVALNSNLRLRGLVENGTTPSTNVPDVGTTGVVQDSHKHAWTRSNRSANWHLPQIRKFTPLKTPVHDSRHPELSLRPVLHPLLRTATLFRPARLHWDVRNQALPVMSSADTAMMQKLLKEPATSPPTTRMLILVRSPVPKRPRVKSLDANPKFWEVDVFPSPASRSHPHSYIKCMDVLRAFGKMLRTSADTSEFDSLDIMHQRLVVRAFEMRAAGVFGRQDTDLTGLEREKAREIRKGYRKVDLLVNQTRSRSPSVLVAFTFCAQSSKL
ncbi:hypothetical protein Clacol_003751 [Clathrus columnatus]|uniref:DUF6699 domain-containing protein n=1 Tax=Clathrus columnatus TaxID=1419009 RepID=A0AAV5A7T4_9AGAM|nr:hypothetical protein Clacol_003751 [Clathrus columnatus]